MRNIAVVGFMGSGKSTVAKLLADTLDYVWCEIDNDVLNLSENSSINEIFDNNGEAYFRELEGKAINAAVKKTRQVISCGGGVVTSLPAMEALKENAVIVFLHADFNTITERLKNTASRPLFRDMERAVALYALRLPLYKKYCDIEIKTDGKTPEEVAAMAAEAIQQMTQHPH